MKVGKVGSPKPSGQTAKPTDRKTNTIEKTTNKAAETLKTIQKHQYGPERRMPRAVKKVADRTTKTVINRVLSPSKPRGR